MKIINFLVEALGLLEPPQPSPSTPYTRLVQSFNRFIFEKLNQECIQSINPVLVHEKHVDEKWCCIQQFFGKLAFESFVVLISSFACFVN
jgi:hypothetical protein